MTRLSSIGCFVLSLLCSVYVYAEPVCTDVFTDPPTGDQSPNGIVPPPDVIANKRGDIECRRDECTVDGQTISTRRQNTQ